MFNFQYHNRGHYSEKDAAKAVRDMLVAVKYLHENGVVHRDMKPENLLYENPSSDSKLKVADFGLSKIIEHEVQMNTVCGTPGYCAPEVLSGKKYGPACDLWSVGVITYILKRDVQKILKANYQFDSPYWDPISENAKDLVRRLLTLDDRKRSTAEQALQHPWVKGKAAKSDHMSETHEKIKTFNANRKLKAATEAMLMVARATRNIPSLEMPKAVSVSDVSIHCVTDSIS
ncbi:hypothetical protein ScPMuIL_017431 [Solemya velum]